MEVDLFKEIIVPVIGGLGIFLLGLEFMASGIQALSVNKMRAWLAKMAGTPVKGVIAGTLITGIIQSSTAMTVMTVGLVNASLGLRSAIRHHGGQGRNTLANGLIASAGAAGAAVRRHLCHRFPAAKNDRCATLVGRDGFLVILRMTETGAESRAR